MIETLIQLKPKSEWRPGVTTDSLRAELDRLVKFPGLTNAWVMPIKTRIDMLATGIKTPVGIKVAGPKLAEIEGIGKQTSLSGNFKKFKTIYIDLKGGPMVGTIIYTKILDSLK